jgi:hypothetical protein
MGLRQGASIAAPRPALDRAGRRGRAVWFEFRLEPTLKPRISTIPGDKMQVHATNWVIPIRELGLAQLCEMN